MDCSLPGSSVHGIFQARVLEWVAISFSRGFSQPRDERGSPALQVDALPSKPPGKPLSKVNVLIKETLENSSIPLCEDTVKESHSWTRKRALTKNQMCQCLDLKLFSPQNCEKWTSVLYKLPSPWSSIAAAQVNGDRSLELLRFRHKGHKNNTGSGRERHILKGESHSIHFPLFSAVIVQTVYLGTGLRPLFVWPLDVSVCAGCHARYIRQKGKPDRNSPNPPGLDCFNHFNPRSLVSADFYWCITKTRS